MNEQEIIKDRQDRVKACKEELEVILGKYQLGLVAEDMIGEKTKISVQFQFVDLKKHDEATVAQPETPVITEDLLSGEGDPIGK